MSRKYTALTDTIKNTSANTFTTGNSTLGFWFKPSWNSGDSIQHQLFVYTLSNIADRYEMLKYSDNNVYAGWNNSGRIVIADTGLFTSGTWTYITLTNTTAPLQTIYFNAVSKGSIASAVTTSVLNELEVGNGTTLGGNTDCRGSMADFAIWTAVLSSAEITALFNGARPPTIRPANLVNYYPFDGLQSPEPDLSGGAHNLTVTGTSLAAGPPVMMFTPRWPQFNQTVAAPTFNPAWALGKNIVIEGVAT